MKKYTQNEEAHFHSLSADEASKHKESHRDVLQTCEEILQGLVENPETNLEDSAIAAIAD